jgi:hypothetical protein
MLSPRLTSPKSLRQSVSRYKAKHIRFHKAEIMAGWLGEYTAARRLRHPQPFLLFLQHLLKTDRTPSSLQH